ncbi:MAG TPA: nucleotidyltransferase domain-containing protein [Thermoanaerobaculia bacterium]|nr:nucleotidyltransferase domain-containing protein [Thermoanaerobaculia bacterium]
MAAMRQWLCYPPPARSMNEARTEEDVMATTAEVSDDLLSKMAQIIVQEVEPERIILFGSHARGEARPDSDVDLLVIEQEGFGKQRSRRREAALLWRALAHFPVSKDILVYSQKEAAAWRDSPGHFLARAMREGKVLYERG